MTDTLTTMLEAFYTTLLVLASLVIGWFALFAVYKLFKGQRQVPVEIGADTPPALVPLAWLLGRWEGAGVVGYPTMEEARFGQEVEFRHDGRPFLHYRSQAYLLDDDGNQVRLLASEAGYWRVPQPASTQIEVLLTHPTGFVEVYLGTVEGPRIELATDVVARTSTAKEYSAAQRMYGLVDGELMWVMEMAAVGHPMTPHLSARLKRA